MAVSPSGQAVATWEQLHFVAGPNNDAVALSGALRDEADGSFLLPAANLWGPLPELDNQIWTEAVPIILPSGSTAVAYTVLSEGQGATYVRSTALPPRYTSLRLKASPAKVRRGAKVKLSVSLSNSGTATGTATVRLLASPKKGARVQSKITFRIAPGRTIRKTVKATVSRKAGNKVVFKARTGNLTRQVKVKVRR
jgi:hypothetical protein